MVSKNAVTIFTCPKPFVGHIEIIQRNALGSWRLLHPRPRIILFGEGEGIARTAREFGAIHAPEIKCSRLGTPLASDVFAQAESMAKGRKMLFTNADMIYNQSIIEAISLVDEKLEHYLAVGQRWDVDIDHEIDFQKAEKLNESLRAHGTLHAPSGMDWMGFPLGQWGPLPGLIIGRAAWDGGMLSRALAARVPVIDCTSFVLAIHQNHDYSHIKGGQREAWHGEEAQYNRSLCNAEKLPWVIDVWHSTWVLNAKRVIYKKGKPLPLPKHTPQAQPPKPKPARPGVTGAPPPKPRLPAQKLASQPPPPLPVTQVTSRSMPLLDRSTAMTIFTSLKAMRPPFDVLQRNALQSWMMLSPRPEIILFGDEGAEIAESLAIKHIPKIECSPSGAPLASSVFALVEEQALGTILCWMNGDVIATQNLIDMAMRVYACLDDFLIIGRRWNLKVISPINFSRGTWWRELRRRVQAQGSLGPPDAIDYLIFTPGLWEKLPPLCIGRAAWDGAAIALALKAGRPVVDASDAIFVVHQDHDYSHVPGGKNEVWNGADAQKNRGLVPDWARTIAHATHKMTLGGLFKKS